MKPTYEELEKTCRRFSDVLTIWNEEACYMAGDLGSPAVRDLIERMKVRIAALGTVE